MILPVFKDLRQWYETWYPAMQNGIFLQLNWKYTFSIDKDVSNGPKYRETWNDSIECCTNYGLPDTSNHLTWLCNSYLTTLVSLKVIKIKVECDQPPLIAFSSVTL